MGALAYCHDNQNQTTDNPGNKWFLGKSLDESVSPLKTGALAK